jgi:Flp pilus assembly protein TadB
MAGRRRRPGRRGANRVGGHRRNRRRLSPLEILIWVAVTAVVGAFLLLLAQHMLVVAVALAGLFLAFAWWELRVRR